MKKLMLLFVLLAVTELAIGADKQTIAQIKQEGTATTWWEALWAMRVSTEAQILQASAFILCMAMFASFWMKWGFKVIEREVSLIDYFYRQDPQRTVGAFLGAYGIIAGGAFTGAFSNEAGEFVGWYNVFYTTFVTGLAADGTVNKADRPEWTSAKREQKLNAPQG